MSRRVNSLPRFGIHLIHPRYLLTWVALFLFFIISLLPVSIIDRIAEAISAIVFRKNKKRVHYASVNLALCFPQKDAEEVAALVRQHFSYHIKSVLHYGLLWWSPRFRVQSMVELVGNELIEQCRASGKQIIALTSHSVGLEFAVAALSLQHECSGPYKSMKNGVIDWLVARGRTRFGVHAFTREDGFRPLIKNTRDGRILIYLADEDLGGKNSVFVPFFGVQKATLPVLGRLAKQCDAVVLPCISCYDTQRHRYTVKLLPAIEDLDSDDELQSALQMNRAIERTVNECVVQYFWTLRLFKTRPEDEESVYG